MAQISNSINKLHPKIIPIFAYNSWVVNYNYVKYLDFTSGIGALSTGHSHPNIITATKKQLDNYVHLPQQVFGTHNKQDILINKLHKIMPSPKLNNFFLVNSGSEAIDNALKISKKYTGKNNIITMLNGFHGRTIGALSITSSNLNCKHKMIPIPGNFFCNEFTKKSLDNILSYQSSPDETAAIIFESVQGESGINSIPKDFLSYARKMCDQHNMILIADEVQCGAGRTGTWWNIEQKNIIPDLMTFGKGIGSGFPIAGVVGNSKIMNNIGTSYLGGTYGGNAVSSVAAIATIETIEKENLLENTINMGNYIKKELSYFDNIKEIRQYGLMIAIEFTFSEKNPRKVKKFLELLREYNILVLLAGNNNQYIRLLPPLNVTKEDIDYFICGFSYAMDQM